jgi:hypothetical protein
MRFWKSGTSSNIRVFDKHCSISISIYLLTVVSNKLWFRRELHKFNNFMCFTPRFRVNSIQLYKVSSQYFSSFLYVSFRHCSNSCFIHLPLMPYNINWAFLNTTFRPFRYAFLLFSAACQNVAVKWSESIFSLSERIRFKSAGGVKLLHV